MNNRIVKLSDDAQQYAEYITPQGLEWFDSYKAKFAELIITESIEVMKQNDFHGEWLGEKIKEHFGIPFDSIY
jgi:hypothetical protein